MGGDVVGFGGFVQQTFNYDWFPVASFGEEGLVGASFVLVDDALGGLEDIAGAAVILLKLDDFGAGKVAFKVEDIGEVGAAPGVDGLPVVTDDADVAVAVHEAFDEVILDGVGVLVLVNEDVLELVLPLGADVGVLAEKFGGAEQKIIKVQGGGGVFLGFVASINGGGVFLVGIDSLGGGSGGRGAGVFPVRDETVGVFGGEGLVAGEFEIAENPANESELVLGIIDGKIAIQAGRDVFNAEQANADTMEGAHIGHKAAGWILGRGMLGEDASGSVNGALAFQETPEAGAHFAGGFVGEGNGKDAAGAGAVGDEVGDAMSEDLGFARASPGQDQEWSGEGFYGLALSGVQTSEN